MWSLNRHCHINVDRPLQTYFETETTIVFKIVEGVSVLLKHKTKPCPSKNDGWHYLELTDNTAQKMECSIKAFFGKCDQIRKFLRIGSHLLKTCLMEHFIFCGVLSVSFSETEKLTLSISRRTLNVVLY